MDKKIQYRLGVDLGTSSVAIMIFRLQDGRPVELIYYDLVIFGEPVLPKEMKLKNEARRKARLMRHTLARKQARIAKLQHLAQHLGIDAEALKTAAKKLKSPHEIWRLRAEAVSQRIELSELFLVLLRMAKNRGYFGKQPMVKKKNSDNTEQAELKQVSAGIAESEELLKSGQTLGQLIWQKCLNQSHRSASGSLKIARPAMRKLSQGGTYVLRQHIEAEFERILDEQKKHHPVLAQSIAEGFGLGFAQRLQSQAGDTRYFWGLQPQTVREALHIALFYQHPLRGFADTIGPCTLEGRPHLRVVGAHPAAEAFRIEKTLGDLRWGDHKNAEKLTPQQRDLLRKLLQEKAEVKFTDIYKKLNKTNLMHPDGLTFNLHTARRETLKGSSSREALKKLGVLKAFDALPAEAQSQLFIAWADHLPAPELWGFDQRLRNDIQQKYGDAVVAFFDHIDQTEKGLMRLKAAGLDGKRMQYGAHAMMRLTALMQAENLDESEAQERLYPQSRAPIIPTGTLPAIFEPGKDSEGNNRQPAEDEIHVVSPVVRRALQETRKVIMRCVKKLGPPTQTVVELTRDMKNSLEDRKKIEMRQAAEEREKRAAKEALQKAGYPVSNTAITRYRLWEQQAHRCPYSGKYLSLEEALSAAATHFEHIAPKRLHGVGNRLDDLVLATHRMNDLKGMDATPFAAAHHPRNLGKWKWSDTKAACEKITSDSKAFKAKAKRILSKDPLEVRGLDEEGFVDRQLQETAWIGRVVNDWCRRLCSDVTVIRGGLTAELRRNWGLHTVLEEIRKVEGKHDAAKAQALFYQDCHYGRGKPKSSKQTAEETGADQPEMDEENDETPEPAISAEAEVEAPVERAFIEADRVFDKRSDHRHHLIDAAVIALSTRENYQQQVRYRHARQAGKKQTAPKPDCPVPTLRDDLIKLLRGFEVWHKPDRMVDGLLFNEQPKKPHTAVSNRLTQGLDKIIETTDRKGRKHRKLLVGAETACMRLTEQGLVPVSLAEYKSKPLHHWQQQAKTGTEKYFYKNDIIYLPTENKFYRIAQLQSGKGLACVPTTETKTFDELYKTKLNITIKNTKLLRQAIVFRSQRELAQFLAKRQRDAA